MITCPQRVWSNTNSSLFTLGILNCPVINSCHTFRRLIGYPFNQRVLDIARLILFIISHSKSVRECWTFQCHGNSQSKSVILTPLTLTLEKWQMYVTGLGNFHCVNNTGNHYKLLLIYNFRQRWSKTRKFSEISNMSPQLSRWSTRLPGVGGEDSKETDFQRMC